MSTNLSRKDRFEKMATGLAKKGHLVSTDDFMLYSGEIRRYERQYGLVIIPSYKSERKVPVIVDWSNPFPSNVPDEVYEYTMGHINTFPKESNFNFAQRLYMIAMRMKNEKM